MAATAKPQKDKPHAPPPRLTPRPTAASAARAARNATNRNLMQRPPHRQSPTRQLPATNNRVKSPALRSDQKSESKSDMTITKEPTIDEFVIDSVPPTEKTDSNNTYDASPPQDSISYTLDTVCCDNVQDNTAQQQPEENEPIQENPNVIEVKSRPNTPKKPSRPQTPRCPSRPTTPAHPNSVASASSRPNTPHVPPLPPTPPLNPKNSSTRVATPNADAIKSQPLEEDGRDVKLVYMEKQKEFHRKKKELDLKQQSVLALFDALRNLSDRMQREGMSDSGEGLQIQELVVFNVGDWTSEEVAQLCRDAVASSDTSGVEDVITAAKPIDEYTLAELDSKVLKVPSCFAELCLRAFSARQELIDWIKELIVNQEEGAGECLDRIARYNAQGIELCEALRELKSHADNAVEAVTRLSRQTCRERTALISVGESLIREIARLREDLESRTVIANEMSETPAEDDTAKKLEDILHELEEERNAKTAVKEKLTVAEAQLRQTRTRVNKMDRQLREAEATIASLTGTVKSLEDQSRQREVQLEARARKLKESLKTGEVTNTQILQQRNALQAEVQTLKEQMETMIQQHKLTVQKLNKEVKDLRIELEQQKEVVLKENELRKTAEAKIAEYQRNVEDLRNKIIELEDSRPNPELPTEREMEIWAELQATKDTLRITEDEVHSCKREKVRFLETLTKISESEDKVGMQQKLAAELLSKEEIIGKMQIQMREMNKSIKFNEQKVMQYEQYIRDILSQTRSSTNCQVDQNGISYQDLQQEILNLRMGLLESVHRNEELSEVLSQKEQALDQQDKTSRAQARVIKVREELINMLKNKETEQSRELATLQQDLEHRMIIVDEVNKQIAAKAEEIQELFATLENKQQQIHRLEKIVLALEEQQRRAQAQRTRHEEKIAALEHELAAGNRRERKFIFF